MPLTAEQQALLAQVHQDNVARLSRGPAYAGPFARATGRRPQPRAATSTEDYTKEFLAELSKRAGIPASEDPDAILAALDLRLYALKNPAAGEGTTQQSKDDAFQKSLDAYYDATFGEQAQSAARQVATRSDDDAYAALFGPDAR